jgi:hypothetical protein
MAGSIYEIGGGRHRAVLILRDEFGLPFRKEFTGKVPKKLKKRMRDFELDYKAGTPTEDMKVEAMCEKAIEACEGRGCAPKTLKGCRDFLKVHIKPHIGAVKIRELSPAHIERLLAIMAEGGAGTQTQLLCRNFIRMSINRIALKGGFVERNVAALADPPRVQHKARRHFTPENLEARKTPRTSRPVAVSGIHWLAAGRSSYVAVARPIRARGRYLGEAQGEQDPRGQRAGTDREGDDGRAAQAPKDQPLHLPHQERHSVQREQPTPGMGFSARGRRGALYQSLPVAQAIWNAQGQSSTRHDPQEAHAAQRREDDEAILREGLRARFARCGRRVIDCLMPEPRIRALLIVRNEPARAVLLNSVPIVSSTVYDGEALWLVNGVGYRSDANQPTEEDDLSWPEKTYPVMLFVSRVNVDEGDESTPPELRTPPLWSLN